MVVPPAEFCTLSSYTVGHSIDAPCKGFARDQPLLQLYYWAINKWLSDFLGQVCLGEVKLSMYCLSVQWSVPEHMRSSFAVQPHMGLLQGNQRKTVTWSFAPHEKATYDTDVTCSFGSPQEASLGGPASMKHLQEALQLPPRLALVEPPTGMLKGLSQQIGVRLVGQGTIGALTLEPSSIDFGTVAVGFPAVQEITLLNQSGGNLCYSITCTVAATEAAVDAAAGAQQGISQPDMQQGIPESSLHDDDSPTHLAIEEPSGALPARATKTLRLTLNPHRRKHYTLQLVCHTATAGMPAAPGLNPAAALPSSQSSPPVFAAVAAFSTYPTVMITDIACQGLDKPFLWNQMRCSQINTELAAEMTKVCPERLCDAAAGRHNCLTWTTPVLCTRRMPKHWKAPSFPLYASWLQEGSECSGHIHTVPGPNKIPAEAYVL